MDDPLLLLLRVVHIGAGIFWVGAAYTMFLFLQPTVRDLGPDGQKFMANLTGKRRFPTFVLAAAALTVAAGAVLYWRDSAGLQLGWIVSPTGIGFTIGSVAAVIAFITGPVFVVPTMNRMRALGQQAMASGQPPGPEAASQLHRLERRLRIASLINVTLLTVAVVTMATARYWG